MYPKGKETAMLRDLFWELVDRLAEWLIMLGMDLLGQP